MVGQARKLLPRVAHDLHDEAVQREVPGPEGMPTIVIVALLLHTCRCTFPCNVTLGVHAVPPPSRQGSDLANVPCCAVPNHAAAACLVHPHCVTLTRAPFPRLI